MFIRKIQRLIMDSDKKCKCCEIFKNQELNCCCNRNDKECVCDEVNYNCCTYNGLFGCCTNEQSNLCDCSIHRLHDERRSFTEATGINVENSENEKLIEDINKVELESDSKYESSCYCNDNYCKRERNCCCILLFGNTECCCKGLDVCCCIRNGNDECCCHHKTCFDVAQDKSSTLLEPEYSRLVENTNVSNDILSTSNYENINRLNDVNTSVTLTHSDFLLDSSLNIFEKGNKSCTCIEEKKHEICRECINKSIDESFDVDHASLLTSSCILTQKDNFKKVDENLINELQNIKSESKEKESYDIFIVNNEGEVNSYEVKHLVNERSKNNIDQNEIKLNQQVHGLCIKNRRTQNKSLYRDKTRDFITKIKRNTEDIEKPNDPIILEITEISNPKSRNAQEIIDNLINKDKLFMNLNAGEEEKSEETKNQEDISKESSLKISDICSLSKEADVLDCLCKEVDNVNLQISTANQSNYYLNNSMQSNSSEEGFFDDKNYPKDEKEFLENNVLSHREIESSDDDLKARTDELLEEADLKQNLIMEEIVEDLCENIPLSTPLESSENIVEEKVDVNIIRDNVHGHLNIDVSPGHIEANLDISNLSLPKEDKVSNKEASFDQIIDEKNNLLDCANILLNQKKNESTETTLKAVDSLTKIEEKNINICEFSSSQNTQSAIRSIDQALGIRREEESFDSCEFSSSQNSQTDTWFPDQDHSSLCDGSTSSNNQSSVSNEDENMNSFHTISFQNTQSLLELNNELNSSTPPQTTSERSNFSEIISSNDSNLNAVEIELRLRDRDSLVGSEQSSTIIFIESNNSKNSIRKNKVGKLIKYFEDLERNK